MKVSPHFFEVTTFIVRPTQMVHLIKKNKCEKSFFNVGCAVIDKMTTARRVPDLQLPDNSKMISDRAKGL